MLNKFLVSIVFLVSFSSSIAQQSNRANTDTDVKMVYHLSMGEDQGYRAVTNIRNHLRADPLAKIMAVSNGQGIDPFIVKIDASPKFRALQKAIAELHDEGVVFKVCGFTLSARGIESTSLLPLVKIVDSGVAEIGRLQTIEGFGYIVP
jgi:intracellular sulfur oxidation DsrE/DsrF family protein